uniref:DUF4408 domain-containing protein n=1 Tax=Panagrellus redivivus TaxID=6233 RepID=A0A7E4ZS95_PANRE
MLGVSLRDSIEVFYLIYNTVLLSCLIMAVRRNYLHKWKRRIKVSSIHAVFEVRGPLGTKMPAKDTIDDHFRALQSSWEGMAAGTRKL